LRRAWAASAATIALRRLSSIASSDADIGSSPRRFSAASKAWALSRIHLMSCMAIGPRASQVLAVMPAKAGIQ
jgi:hypothetical protein